MEKTTIKDPKDYQARVKAKMPRSKTLFQCVMAFLSGGLICSLAQLIQDLAGHFLALDQDARSAFTAIVMVFLGATLTGLGLYDKIGSVAGAGSIVPITGFANSIVSPAMEFKREGLVLGTAARMFVIAGPVLVYGILSSVLAGLFFCIFQ